MRGEAPGQPLSWRRHGHGLGGTARCRHLRGFIAAALAATLLLSPQAGVHAQQGAQVHISVSPTIVARPASQTSLGIEVGPPWSLPKRSFVSLRGLPASIALTEGHLVGVGSWAVPLKSLPTLKANVPVDVSGRSELVINVISMEGSLLAVARTALVVAPQAMAPPSERAPADSDKKPLSPPAPAPAWEPEPEVRFALNERLIERLTAPKEPRVGGAGSPGR